jgi:outer membrane protein, heavy metal efflux system
MNARFGSSVLIVMLATSASAAAQAPGAGTGPRASRYTDPVNGLSLEEAVARAIEHEPSLRAAQTSIDVAQGMRVQAGLRPNPSVSFERREEPGGTDNQTSVAVEWPLDLFRRHGRVAVADHEVAVTRLAVADSKRILISEVRTRYGDALTAIRELATFDELVAATQRQHELLRSRAEEGAAPPLERDLLAVELGRLESDRLLQAGRTEAALFELKRVLGMNPDTALTLRDTLEDVVHREPAALSDRLAAETTVQSRPDVLAAEARIDVAEARIERARREGRFDVSLFGNYMRMDAGFPQLGFNAAGALDRVRGRFQYWSAGAMVTVPVLNRNQGDIAVARAERAGAAAAYEAARLTAQMEVAAARTRHAHAEQAVRLYSTGAQALAAQNLSVVSQSYELGRATVYDVLAEQRRYLEVERAYTDALRAAYEAQTALTRALGELP